MIEALLGFGAVVLGVYGLEAVAHQDFLPGGRADRYSPRDFDAKQLRDGTNVEMEHTNDRRIAREIAMDHLREDPDYYKALAKMEDRLEQRRKRRHMRWKSAPR